jgi:hypothetical protein
MVSRRNRVQEPVSLEEITAVGQQADRILKDEAFLLAVQKAEDLFEMEWRQATDPQKREMAWAKVHALEEVTRTLRSIMDNAHIEATRAQKGLR